MPYLTSFVIVALLVICLCPSKAEVRTWTNQNGVSITAELISVEGNLVKIRRESDGREFSIPLTTLSEADQTFAKQSVAPKLNAPAKVVPNFLPPITKFEAWKPDVADAALIPEMTEEPPWPEEITHELQKVTWEGESLELEYLGERPLLIAQVSEEGPSNGSFAVRTDGSIVWEGSWDFEIVEGLPLGEPEQFIKFEFTRTRSGYKRGEFLKSPRDPFAFPDGKIGFREWSSGDLFRIDQRDPISITKLGRTKDGFARMYVPPFDLQTVYCFFDREREVRVLRQISENQYDELSEPWFRFKGSSNPSNFFINSALPKSPTELLVAFSYGLDGGSSRRNQIDILILIDREASGYYLLAYNLFVRSLSIESVTGRMFAAISFSVGELRIPEL